MSGFVTDKQSRHPLEGARVTIIGNKAKSDTTTDSDGAFIVSLAQGVAEGKTVRIRVEKSGYKPYEKLMAVSPEIPLRVPLESISEKKPSGKPHVTKPAYDRAHLAVVGVDLWAEPMISEAMITVRNVGSKPILPCAILRGAIIISPWLSGSEEENQLFIKRYEWQEGGKRQVNCDTDWNPGVEKTYSIQANVSVDGPDDWTSLMLGDKLWYVVSRLYYQDWDSETALPPIENCVYFRAQQPEWHFDKCFGHNDPTRNHQWISGSGRMGPRPREQEKQAK
jgi:hypothetical protein